MTIRSNPPGAFVYVDNYPIGVTPVSTDYVYYGRRQFRLVRDGFETLTTDQDVRAPWYEWYGLDFVSENVVPFKIRDERTLNFQLIPQQIPPREQLMGRAEEMRRANPPPQIVAPPPQAVTGPGAAPLVPPTPLAPPGQPGLQTPLVPPGQPPYQVLPPPSRAAGQPQYQTLPPGGQSMTTPPPGQ